MKKLLVILLLLFPVHGAWAEDKIIELKCDLFSKSGNIIDTLRFRIYPEPLSTIKDLTGSFTGMKNKTDKLTTTARAYSWVYSHEIKKYRLSFYLDRYTGELSIKGEYPWTDNDSNKKKTQTVYTGSCQKLEDKKL